MTFNNYVSRRHYLIKLAEIIFVGKHKPLYSSSSYMFSTSHFLIRINGFLEVWVSLHVFENYLTELEHVYSRYWMDNKITFLINLSWLLTSMCSSAYSTMLLSILLKTNNPNRTMKKKIHVYKNRCILRTNNSSSITLFFKLIIHFVKLWYKFFESKLNLWQFLA